MPASPLARRSVSDYGKGSMVPHPRIRPSVWHVCGAPNWQASAIILVLALTAWCALASCSGIDTPSDSADAISGARKAELERLFDRAGSLLMSEGEEAAAALTALPATEQDYIALLWGSRSINPLLARRIGKANLAAAGEPGSVDNARLERAFLWLQRAIVAMGSGGHDTEPEFAARLRYDLARAYVLAGKNSQAIELLANRIDPRPLSPELEFDYDALLTSLAATTPE